MTAEKLFEHQGAILLAQSDGCAVWQFRNETGDGTMTTYEIFSGVMLAFNDFHMERYECDFVADRRMLAIDMLSMTMTMESCMTAERICEAYMIRTVS